MPTTSPDDISYPDTSWTGGIVAAFAAVATSVQTAFSKRQIRTYKWANAAARDAQTGMSEGDQGDQADTNTTWRYSGSAWKAATSSMNPVVPTSVTNGSVTLGGWITSTAQSSVSVNGCFTSDYDWYEIIFDCTMSAASGINVRLRASGTNASTAYDNQRFSVVNTTVAGLQSLNSSDMLLSTIGLAGRHVGKLLLMNPALAQATVGTSESWVTDNPSTTSSGRSWSGVQHRTATAYDGFTVIPGSGTVTINGIRISGISQS